MKIQIKILDEEFYGDSPHSKESGWDRKTVYYKNNELPKYATPGSAAIDLIATKDYTIYPGERVMIGTGLAIWIASLKHEWLGNEENDFSVAGFIIPRSGLGTKGLVLANTVGLIDEDYQGELLVSAWNSNNEYKTVDQWNTEGTIKVKAGDHIAQMYFAPVIKAQFEVVEEFTESTDRNSGGGFGSTGI